MAGRKIEEIENAVWTYNILGLEEGVKADANLLEEMKKLEKDLLDFEKAIRKRRAQISQGYVKEKWPDAKYQTEKRSVAEAILEKIRRLHESGNANKIYKTDYVRMKKILLKSLFESFGTALDVPNYRCTLSVLEDMEMIPPELKGDVVYLCPIGRWY